MQVREVMSCPAVTLRPHAPVPVAAARLVEHGFTGAPVMDAEGRLLGVVTEADLLRGGAGRGAATAPVAVREVMSVPPRVTEPTADLADVVASMLAAGVRMVPVVEGELLVGVLTRRDALRAVARPRRTVREVTS
jgi:CBS domain-containing protein